ncbi:MAG: 2-hydroxyacid dehydrogenase [Hyphomicrobiaceae bacterium]|nr:2-hydroxyacid dehydrogenase [Hyphomicrobiaceae bacterium]
MVTLAVLDRFHPHIKAAIESAVPTDWRAVFIEESTLAARVALVRDADIAFVMAAPIPKEVVTAARKLRFIQKLGAGVDRIDLDACRDRGIGVARLHAGNSVPVAEHTVLLMLAVYRQLPQIDRRTRAGAWDKEAARGEHRQLFGKTIGLVGLGAVGRDVAKRLRGFDVSMIYYDPVRAPAGIEQSLGVRYVDLDDLVRGADIVSLHLPLMPQTAGIINTGRIHAMKRGAVLINCARGGLVDEAALAAALKDGHLFGAGIDAFSSEPPVGSELLALDNTVITSHLAGATLDNFSSIVARAVANAEAVLCGVPLAKTDEVLAPGVS